jgi:hypothetical protein
MAIELSNLMFTDQDDIVPSPGVAETLINTGIANTLAGNDRLHSSANVFSSAWGFFNSGTLDTGEGNDIITGSNMGADGFVNRGTFNTGAGNDTVDGAGYFQAFANYGTFNTGEGDDVITSFYGRGGGIYSAKGSIFDTGDGNDRIMGSSYGGIDNYSDNFTTGDGNDTIDGGMADNYSSIYNGGVINTGNGEDYISSKGLINRGGVFLGDGNDWIYTNRSSSLLPPDRVLENLNFIDTGDGNDRITGSTIYNQGVINTGNGNDYIEGVDITGVGYGIYNNGGAINMGDGNDSIIASQGFGSGENSSGAWFLGEGDDYIKGFGSGDFYGGNGNDTLQLTPGIYTLKKWADNTGESVVFTKGNSLMITSEFEKLSAAGTTYDFASLTDGQIIVVHKHPYID